MATESATKKSNLRLLAYKEARQLGDDGSYWPMGSTEYWVDVATTLKDNKAKNKSKETPKAKNGLYSIPVDVLDNIVVHLHTKDVLFLAAVNRYFRGVLCTETFWKRTAKIKYQVNNKSFFDTWRELIISKVRPRLKLLYYLYGKVIEMVQPYGPKFYQIYGWTSNSELKNAKRSMIYVKPIQLIWNNSATTVKLPTSKPMVKIKNKKSFCSYGDERHLMINIYDKMDSCNYNSIYIPGTSRSNSAYGTCFLLDGKHFISLTGKGRDNREYEIKYMRAI